MVIVVVVVVMKAIIVPVALMGYGIIIARASLAMFMSYLTLAREIIVDDI